MYYTQDTIMFLDGKFMKASDISFDLFSQTLHYGNGVFEGMRSYATKDGPKIFKAKEHYERLLYSAEKMRLAVNYSAEELTRLSYDLLAKNEMTDAYIRPLVYAAPNMSLSATPDAHLLLTAFKWGKLLGNNLVNLMISSFQRPNPKSVFVDAKVCGHYVNSILATSEARSKGFHDAILLDMQGNLAEAAGANVFIEKDEILYTPPKGNILPGITRETVIEMAEKMRVKVVEKPITLDELFEADGAFLTGTAAEITGISTVDRRGFKMRWEDTTGFILSRKYHKLVTHADHYEGTLI